MPNNTSEKKTTSVFGFLKNYSDSIQKGIDNGGNYVELFNQLISTSKQEELLSSAAQLTTFKLNSDFVTFPQQFSDEDVQLIFMKRILDLSNNQGSLEIIDTDVVQKMFARFPEFGDQTFTFRKVAKTTGGYFFNSSVNNKPLFYLNLKTKELFFNGDELIQFFVVDFKDIDSKKINDTLETLIKLATLLKENFGFRVDFNVLDSVNDELFEFAGGDVPEGILDQLFVDSAANNYVLMADENGGAYLTLKNRIKLTVFNNGNDEKPAWGAKIEDPEQKESWLKLLLDYDFIKDWYLKNQKQLEIMSDQFVFG